MPTDLTDAFGLVVRFHLKPGCEQGFDDLTAQTVPLIQAHEPGTVLYICQTVEGAPTQRIFYELYANRAAFDAHESQPHVKHFLSAREAFVERFEVDFLSPMAQAGALFSR